MTIIYIYITLGEIWFRFFPVLKFSVMFHENISIWFHSCVSFHHQQLFYFLILHVSSVLLASVVAVQAGHQHDVSLRSALLRGLGSGGKRSALKNSALKRSALKYFDFPVYKWEIYGNIMKYDEIWWNMWSIDLLTSEISGPRLFWSPCGG